MTKSKSFLLAAAVSILSLQLAASGVQAESAKHAINTKGTGSNNGKFTCATAKKHKDWIELNSYCYVVQSKKFNQAGKRGDVETMQQMLAKTSLSSADPDPLLIPQCIPPYGVLVWGWYIIIGPNGPQNLYGQYCARGGLVSELNEDLFSYPD